MKVTNHYIVKCPLNAKMWNHLYKTEDGKYYMFYDSRVGCDMSISSLVEVAEEEALKLLEL